MSEENIIDAVVEEVTATEEVVVEETVTTSDESNG